MAVIENLKDRADSFASSTGELNRFYIDKIEEIARMNLASASWFSEVGIRQMRALSNVRDLDSMRRFTADSISLSGEIAKKVLDDSKAWMSLGVDVREKVSEVLGKEAARAQSQPEAASQAPAGSQPQAESDARKKSGSSARHA
jgi:phasin family protein